MSSYAISSATKSISYLNAEQSKLVDERLMVIPGFSIDQLMELAGYSVAASSMSYFTQLSGCEAGKKVLVLCGPGNNGGDGLVAARHLKQFGFHPSVVYPKQGKGAIFENLVRQMIDLEIPVLQSMPASSELGDFPYALDALFGFSFKGPPREPYKTMLQSISSSSMSVVSVDVPSGWDVDKGDIHQTGFLPSAVVSLTAPKLCMHNYSGVHYVGGRFVPPTIAEELGITLADYGFNSNQFVLLSPGDAGQRAVGSVSAATGDVLVANSPSMEAAVTMKYPSQGTGDAGSV
eukprot:CAMPEP_0170401326 /NCGR_PEP_ID=MMETSP0117_2-20130122/24965_1 /TAXON_ID=400756 /ORGANISM="Durinskia baltica, Strain CSIRO CS-38" /LENGTH=290 /DNA_ID=CAMNT_0010658121 /DNA_START=67 /DNA_END=939 /DNA_ORIENTATION=-